MLLRRFCWENSTVLAQTRKVPGIRIDPYPYSMRIFKRYFGIAYPSHTQSWKGLRAEFRPSLTVLESLVERREVLVERGEIGESDIVTHR